MAWQGGMAFAQASSLEKGRFPATSKVWHGSCLGRGTAPPRRISFRVSREGMMLNASKMSQGLVAMVAALLLTATAVGAAVGPARALETAPVSLAQAPVSGQALA